MSSEISGAKFLFTPKSSLVQPDGPINSTSRSVSSPCFTQFSSRVIQWCVHEPNPSRRYGQSIYNLKHHKKPVTKGLGALVARRKLRVYPSGYLSGGLFVCHT